MKLGEQNDGAKQGPVLPLVRLSLIMPFVEALDRLRVNADAVLMTNGIVRETVRDPSVFVPPIVVHRFLEDAARAAKDPYLGVRVGERLDLGSWPPFVDAVSRATTLGEFLIRFIRSTQQEASSARHSLEVGATHTSFRETRTSEQEIAPAQNDAFTAAYTLGVLREGTGTTWVPKNVLLKVCNPDVLPERYLGVSIVGGDRMGMAVRFPTEWLFGPLRKSTLLKDSTIGAGRIRVPVAFLDALRHTLMLHLDSADLGVDLVAQLSGMSRQSLQRKLKASRTTLSAEIIELKKKRAAEYLAESAKPVGEIATALGFTNPASFARAFKSWTGESPREYRKSRRRH